MVENRKPSEYGFDRRRTVDQVPLTELKQSWMEVVDLLNALDEAKNLGEHAAALKNISIWMNTGK